MTPRTILLALAAFALLAVPWWQVNHRLDTAGADCRVERQVLTGDVEFLRERVHELTDASWDDADTLADLDARLDAIETGAP